MGTLNRFPAMRQEVSDARIIVSPKKENCIYEEKCKEWEVTKEVVDKFIMKERMSQEDGSN